MFDKLFKLLIICCKHKKIKSTCCEIDINDISETSKT